MGGGLSGSNRRAVSLPLLYLNITSDMIPRFMMGCTPHCVVGLEGSIVHGRHYYSTCGIRRHCFGLVHTLVLGYSITNTFHDDGTRSMIRQLMALWYRHFIIRDGFERKLAPQYLQCWADD